jgi:dipeptidyl-peptidase 4
MSNIHGTRTRATGKLALLAGLAALVPSTSVAQVAWTPAAPGSPRTAAELNGFTAHTRHLEMWDYLRALRGSTSEMRLASYGQTREGRALPYAIFSRPLVSEPWEAWELGRPIVVLGANVHGDERRFREGLLILMRDLATSGTEANALLDEVTVIVTPQLNPDGFEAREGGQRGNSWGIDLNRDYVKLEHPAIASLVANVIAAWRPHLFVDGHDGGSRPYNVNYQCPSHYDAMRELTLLCDEEIFPAIDAGLAEEGYRGWYYQRGSEQEWLGGGYEPRIGRNYLGFTNSIGLLIEAPQQPLQDGARAGYIAYLSILRFVAENGERVMGVVERARSETLAMGAEPRGEIAVSMEYAAEDYPVDYLLVRGGRGQGSGSASAPEDTIAVTGARLVKKPVATRLRPRPWAYVLPRDAVDAVAMLRRHGITVERLEEPTLLRVDAYTIEDVTYEEAYNHAAALRVQVGRVITREQQFPAGTYVVPTAQYLGRLVAHMLEPETSDNVIYWNTMDAWIPRPRSAASGRAGGPPGLAGGQVQTPVVPIYKVMRPVDLSSTILE